MANTANMLLWVEALESGAYTQTKGRLRDADGYCCLGVACEVALHNGLGELNVRKDGDGITYGGCDADLPVSVQEWLGLDAGSPDVGLRGDDSACDSFEATGVCSCDESCEDEVTAIDANDDLGWSFLKIATGIRSYYGLPAKEEKGEA